MENVFRGNEPFFMISENKFSLSMADNKSPIQSDLQHNYLF